MNRRRSWAMFSDDKFMWLGNVGWRDEGQKNKAALERKNPGQAGVEKEKQNLLQQRQNALWNLVGF